MHKYLWIGVKLAARVRSPPSAVAISVVFDRKRLGISMDGLADQLLVIHSVNAQYNTIQYEFVKYEAESSDQIIAKYAF